MNMDKVLLLNDTKLFRLLKQINTKRNNFVSFHVKFIFIICISQHSDFSFIFIVY